MKQKLRVYLSCLYAATLGLATGPAFAGVTSAVVSVNPAGSVLNDWDDVVYTPALGANPWNSSSTNTWSLSKSFTSLDPIDIVFSVDNSPSGGRTTEYLVTETVTNNTEMDWIGYRVQLGFGTGSNFSISPDEDALDFDEENLTAGSNYQPSSTTFAFCTACPLGTDTLIFKGALLRLRAGASDTITFHVDVPNSSLAIPSGNLIPGDPDPVGFTFTLRQTPTVIPVPAGFVLMLSALVSIGAGLWRRQGV